MTAPPSKPLDLTALLARNTGVQRTLSTRDQTLALGDFAAASSLAGQASRIDGRSVILQCGDMAKTAAALIELDGRARRLTLLPPDFDENYFDSVIRDCEADALVHDGDAPPPDVALETFGCHLPLIPVAAVAPPSIETEWALLTSGTSGPPKLVAHTLASLTGAIVDAPAQNWATFYDIRRYGGLQILLRGLAGRGSLTLSSEGEPLDALLARFGAAGVTHISGTPSHWRKVLMSAAARLIAPDYVRLSGEIADAAVLAALAALYPHARVSHAYASTEAGVAFTVEDGQPGFPVRYCDGGVSGVDMTVVDDSLRIRSARTASRYLGEGAPPLRDAQGFVDTGDIVERRGDRYLFAGRRNGVINVGGAKVHPEEVEAVINAHAGVLASLVKARKNAITGALVTADIVLRDGVEATDSIRQDIVAACRAQLAPHKTPTFLRFVAELAVTAGGKLARHG